MAAFPEFDSEKFKADAEKAISIPLGFSSPLWFAYAGMASAGVAYWWMSQLAKPENLEALHGMVEKYSLVPVPETPVIETPVLAVEPPPVPAPPLAAEPVFEDVIEPMVPEPAMVSAAVAVEPVAEAIEAVADDLTRLVGIGPTLAMKLSDLGVKTYNDIASWTADDIEKFDKSLNLMGRVRREDWVGQARQFADQMTAH